MRIVFMGTPEFAVPCLQKLIDCGHEVTGVFTQPDKPQGRKMILTPPPVKVLAQSNSIKVYQPEKMRDGTALEMLKEASRSRILSKRFFIFFSSILYSKIIFVGVSQISRNPPWDRPVYWLYRNDPQKGVSESVCNLCRNASLRQRRQAAP